MRKLFSKFSQNANIFVKMWFFSSLFFFKCFYKCVSVQWHSSGPSPGTVECYSTSSRGTGGRDVCVLGRHCRAPQWCYVDYSSHLLHGIVKPLQHTIVLLDCSIILIFIYIWKLNICVYCVPPLRHIPHFTICVCYDYNMAD